MRPTLPALAAWTPSALNAEAARLAQAADSLEVAAGQILREFDTIAADWTGGAADAARERVGDERRALLALADAWASAARALDSGSVTLSTLIGRTLDLVTAARAESLDVDARGAVHARPAWLDLLDWLRRIRAAKEYAAVIGDALTTIDEVDRDMALAVAAGAGGASNPASMLDGAPPIVETPGEPGGESYVIGPPTRPELTWDNDFVYGSRDAEFDDYTAAAEWKAKMAGARVTRWDLDDALDAYGHYWQNSGEPFVIDYDEAYREDESVRSNVEDEIARAATGADRLVAAGNTQFAMSGDATTAPSYPATENWQKTIGGYQQWSSANVTLDGGTVTMTVTVHAEDYYNFNRGQADIASGAPDDANGRFTEIGWAKPFPTSGELTRTITWPVGSPGTATDVTTTEEAGR